MYKFARDMQWKGGLFYTSWVALICLFGEKFPLFTANTRHSTWVINLQQHENHHFLKLWPKSIYFRQHQVKFHIESNIYEVSSPVKLYNNFKTICCCIFFFINAAQLFRVSFCHRMQFSFYIRGIPGCQSLFKEWPSFLLCPERTGGSFTSRIKEIDSAPLYIMCVWERLCAG